MNKKLICRSRFMKNQTNLRFLLALGNTKIVVLKEQGDLQVYSSPAVARKKQVAAERLADALALR